MKQLAQELGLDLDNLVQGEAAGTELLGHFDGRPYSVAAMTADLKTIWQQLHKDTLAASYPTTYLSSTDRGRQLDQLSIAQWIDLYVPGGRTSQLGQMLDVAYNIEYGAETTAQSSLNMLYLLGYVGPGQFRTFGKSNEKFHVRGGNDLVVTRMAQQLDGQIQVANELVAIALTSGGTYKLTFRAGSGTTTVTVDHVVLALPFSTLRLVDTSKAGFGATKARAIRELGMGTNSKLHLQFKQRFWADLGSSGETYSDRGYQSTWEVSRAQSGTLGHPRRLHRRDDRRELRERHADVEGEDVPRPDRAGSARRDGTVERQGRARLLDGLRVDPGLVLVLEGRPVHGVFRRRRRALRKLPLCGRAHLAGLAGLPQRRGRNR